MQKLELNFDKKDIEVEINGKVYGFNLNNNKLEQMKSLQKKADQLNSEDEEEVIIALEDGLDLIYGEGTIDDIFGDNLTTRATLLEILFLTINAIKEYGNQFGVEVKNEEIKTNDTPKLETLNRQQRRARKRAEMKRG